MSVTRREWWKSSFHWASSAQPPQSSGHHDSAVIAVALGDDLHLAMQFCGSLVAGFAQFLQERARGWVDDGVNRVQAQTIDVEVGDPLQGVLDEVAADLVGMLLLEIQGGAPGCFVPVGEIESEIGRVVPFRAEMVVDHVEHDAHALGVAGVRPGVGELAGPP